MEKSKKSQNEKSFLKNPINSIKFDLKNFQNIFVISVFLIFIFIMAATAISVWMSKQAEPPTVEEYCVNCKVFNPQQDDVFITPSTALPVLRIFGKDTQVCQQACQNLRPIFNIQFECVPLAGASQEKIEKIYTALFYSFYSPEENFLTEEPEKPVETLSYSASTQGILKMAEQEIKMPMPEEKQKISVEGVKNLFLESNPETIFFIDGHIIIFDGIPNKEDICEWVEHENCPPRALSSFLPNRNSFSLIKKCYAWGPSWMSGGGSSSRGSSLRLKSYTSSKSTRSNSTPPRLKSYTSSRYTSSSSTRSRSVPSRLVSYPRSSSTSSRSTKSSGSSSSSTPSRLPNYSSPKPISTLNVSPNGVINPNGKRSVIMQGSSSGDIQLAEQGVEIADENKYNILNEINPNSLAAAELYPEQSFYSMYQESGGVPYAIISGVIRTELGSETLSVDARTYITFGDGSLSTYMVNGSPSEITTDDGNRWRREPLNEIIDGKWRPVMNPATGEPMFAYRLILPEERRAIGSGSGSGSGNHRPTTLITCNPSSCRVTTQGALTLRNSSFDLEDGTNFSSCRWDIYQRSDLTNSIQINPTCGSLTPTLSSGKYQAKLRVTDQGGLSDTATRNFNILRAITADFEADNWNPYWKTAVRFTDQSAPTEGETINSWSWTFENGQPATSNEQNPSVVFSVQGTKNITLTATDTSGLSHSATKQLGVRIPPPKWREVSPASE